MGNLTSPKDDAREGISRASNLKIYLSRCSVYLRVHSTGVCIMLANSEECQPRGERHQFWRVTYPRTNVTNAVVPFSRMSRSARASACMAEQIDSPRLAPSSKTETAVLVVDGSPAPLVATEEALPSSSTPHGRMGTLLSAKSGKYDSSRGRRRSRELPCRPARAVRPTR